MESGMAWAFGLALGAVLLFLLELLVPSGGIIGIASFIAVIFSIVAFFGVSEWWGIGSIGVFIVLVPLAINFAIKILPHTPIGRRLMLGDLEDEEEGAMSRQERERLEREQAQALVGAQGVTLSDLRPVGAVEIEGARIEALSEAGVIPAGTRVRVVRVEGMQVKVRPVD